MVHAVCRVMVIGTMVRGRVRVHLRNITMLVVGPITVRGLARDIIRRQMITTVTSVLIDQATHIIPGRHRLIRVRGNATQGIMVHRRRAIHHAKHAAVEITVPAEPVALRVPRSLTITDIRQIQ